MSSFARETLDRAIKTAIQFVLASAVFNGFLGDLMAGDFRLVANDWAHLGFAAFGAFLSVVFSGISLLVGDGSPNMFPPTQSPTTRPTSGV